MYALTSEKTFEDHIAESLIAQGGYVAGNAANFSRELAFDRFVILRFLQDTQPRAWERIRQIHGDLTESKLVQRLYKELELRGTVDVLRNGFIDYGVRFQMAYFKPETSLNPDTLAQYAQNVLGIYRQVRYSLVSEKSVDLVLTVNGLPVATAELKNQTAGQRVQEAMAQYRTARSGTAGQPNELLFQSRKRAVVHFAVDTDEVYMTTRLDGERTRYLPFNKGGDEGGRGNPKNDTGYRTAYLWETIWAKDSWLEIIKRFIHVQVDTVRMDGRDVKRETIIFPRYHQLDVVRKLAQQAQQEGVGQNYLIQHSAGSGKSNSIAWLAYRLFSLHNSRDQRVFDNVVVITDRRVLDQQLQSTIYQFEHISGVVQRIDRNTDQLRDALIRGTGIIITTLQKFPFVLQSIDKLTRETGDDQADLQRQIVNRRYALIVDEAHSSQGGEAVKDMKAVLSQAGTLSPEQALEAAARADGDTDDWGEDLIRKTMEARGKQANLSFFAFTATPKDRTLQVFGQPHLVGDKVDYKPFHLYSMRQAIEEGFILNVLENYTTYEQFYQFTKHIEDDPELNKRKAALAIGRFASLHPHVLSQKTEVIIEHFRQVVAKKIGGKAKAMVVTNSRLHALRYYFSFTDYLRQKQYAGIRALVAFSGKVPDELFPEGVTEAELNGFGEKELPEKFATDDYQILLVADKYQTGFDQPLLHTMYVDKPLSGVRAVQTLSRLNRTHPGKEDTFVLDFVNDRDTIVNAFQPYYQLAKVQGEKDPNRLYDDKRRLDQQQVYWPDEIANFCRYYFQRANAAKYQPKLNAWLDPAVDRYKALPTNEDKELFKRELGQWTRLYSFMSQVVPFQDVELEKFYAYGKMLLTKLPMRDLSEQLKLGDEIALEYYRLQKIAEGNIELIPQDEYSLRIIEEGSNVVEKEQREKLSQIIRILNDRFGTDFTDADRLFFDQIETELINDEKLISQAKNNTIDNFKYGFEDSFIQKLLERMEQNQDIFNKLLDDKEFGDVVKAWMLEKVYRRINSDESE